MNNQQITLVHDLMKAVHAGDGPEETRLIYKLRLTALDEATAWSKWHVHDPAPRQDSTGTVQIKMTTTTSGASAPPPSTPQPVGFNYKQENYIQSLKDNLVKMTDLANSRANSINEMAADIHQKDKTIESLKTHLDSANNHGQNLCNKVVAQGDEIHKQAVEIAALKKKNEDLHKVIDVMAKQKSNEDDCESANIARLQSENKLLCERLKHRLSEVKSLTETVNGQHIVIAEKNKAIEMLNNQVELLTKRIKEDRQHWDDKTASADEYRQHNNELVAANGEIYDALRHWGLGQGGRCSLVNNVKQVIQLCAERGKMIGERAKSIELLTADLARMDRRVNEKNILINQLHSDLHRRAEQLTKLEDDNKKLNKAIENQAEANQKMADNIAKLRYVKDSMEEDYLKKLTAKSQRISNLKEAGTALYRELKTMYPACHIRVSDMLKKWEDEAL